MARSPDNLYRIDDVLIRAGYVLGIFVLLGSFGLMESSLLRSWSLLFLVAPVVLLVSGYRVRRRETRTVELGRVMQVHPSMPVTELCEMTGFSRAQLRDAVNLLNRKTLAGLTYDDSAGSVRHASLAVKGTRTHAQRCGSCGASVSVTVEADTRVENLSCTYCNGALDSAAISQLQHQLQVRGAAPQYLFAGAEAPAPKKRFSLGLFIVLMFFFWPAAVGYAFYCFRSSPLSID